MPTSKLFTPRDAAQVLGVSYPTVKRWIFKKKIRTVKTAITASLKKKLAASSIEQTSAETFPTGAPIFRRISGRNQLVGRVTDIKISGLIAQVTVSMGGQRIYVHHHRRCRPRNGLEGFVLLNLKDQELMKA